jgi:ribonuclease HI
LAALRAGAGAGAGADQPALRTDARPPTSDPAPPTSDLRPPTSSPAFPLVPGSDYTVVFDGGADPNPGRGYGSFQIVGPHGVVAHRTVQLGDRVTNNQAEYRTLIHALETVAALPGLDPARTTVAVRGDSDLLIKQLTGQWKVKHPEIRPLHARALALLAAFARTDVKWHGRAHSVRVLGH